MTPQQSAALAALGDDSLILRDLAVSLPQFSQSYVGFLMRQLAQDGIVVASKQVSNRYIYRRATQTDSNHGIAQKTLRGWGYITG